jgi:DNA polymerase (family 10)
MPFDNGAIAALLRETALLLELDGSSARRIRAYAKAAQFVAAHHTALAGLSEREISGLPHIGHKMAAHIAELARRGSFLSLEELRAKLPPTLPALAAAFDMGPRRAREIHIKLGISSLEQLYSAAGTGLLRKLPDFGADIESAVLRGTRPFAPQACPLLWWDGMALAEEMMRSIGAQQMEIAGTLRRGEETTGEISILCCDRESGSAISRFVLMPQVQNILLRTGNRASVELHSGHLCELRAARPEYFGAMLLNATGSDAHYAGLCERARHMGLLLDETGLYQDDTLLAAKTEHEIYARLGLQFVPPELREGGGEIALAASGKLPSLVEERDIRGDFHNHTVESDGHNTLEEMAVAARELGWQWVAIGDHTQSLGVARGLSASAIMDGKERLTQLQKRMDGLTLLRAAEVEILRDGALDFCDEDLAKIDIVAASVHSDQTLGMEEMTARILRAVKNTHVDLLSHPTGRLIGRRKAYAFREDAVFAAAASSNTALEINGQPERQDLSAQMAARARAAGASIALSTDAHSVKQLGFMSQAVKVARRAGLERKDILNCLDAGEIKKRFA